MSDNGKVMFANLVNEFFSFSGGLSAATLVSSRSRCLQSTTVNTESFARVVTNTVLTVFEYPIMCLESLSITYLAKSHWEDDSSQRSERLYHILQKGFLLFGAFLPLLEMAPT